MRKLKKVTAFVCLKMLFIGALLPTYSAAYGKALSCQQVFESKPQELQKSLETKYASIEETLYIGLVESYEPFSKNNNKNPIWKLVVRNPKTKQQVVALLKPRPWGDGDGWNRTTMEYVGYRISQMLNMDYIAPVAYRRNLSFGSQFIHEGSIQLFVQKAKSLHLVEKSKWPVNPDLFLSDARVLDVLLQNPDRHKDNFMMGDHWITEKSTPLLIDQAASLKSGTQLAMNSPGWGLEGSIKTFKRSSYEGLLALNQEKLNTLKEFLSYDEIEKILSRKNEIVSHVRDLIRRNGEDAVLFD
jgi:hypothetical protein